MKKKIIEAIDVIMNILKDESDYLRIYHEITERFSDDQNFEQGEIDVAIETLKEQNLILSKMVPEVDIIHEGDVGIVIPREYETTEAIKIEAIQRILFSSWKEYLNDKKEGERMPVLLRAKEYTKLTKYLEDYDLNKRKSNIAIVIAIISLIVAFIKGLQ